MCVGVCRRGADYIRASVRGGVIPLREKKQGNEKEEDILSIKIQK